MPFQPGQSGNPAGRPAGAGRKWASLEYWFKIIETNLDQMKPAEQIAIAKWAMELLIGKMKEIQTPEDSAATADAAMKILKEMENRPAK